MIALEMGGDDGGEGCYDQTVYEGTEAGMLAAHTYRSRAQQCIRAQTHGSVVLPPPNQPPPNLCQLAPILPLPLTHVPFRTTTQHLLVMTTQPIHSSPNEFAAASTPSRTKDGCCVRRPSTLCLQPGFECGTVVRRHHCELTPL